MVKNRSSENRVPGFLSILLICITFFWMQGQQVSSFHLSTYTSTIRSCSKHAATIVLWTIVQQPLFVSCKHLDVGFEKLRLKERGINADSHSSLRKRRAKIMVGTKQKLRDLGPNDHDSVVISNSRNVNIFEEMVYNKGPNENKADGRTNLQRKIRQNSSRPQKPSMNKRRKSVKDNIIDISRRRNYYLEYQGLSMSMITNTKSPTPVPNKSPTGEPSRLQPSSGECIEPNKRITILNKRLKKVSGNSINNIKIPQGQAAEWLFSVDSINQCDPTVEQRYALAVFYFSTNGDDWYKNTGWLTAESECTWFAIECDDLGRLTKIGASQNFSKFGAHCLALISMI